MVEINSKVLNSCKKIAKLLENIAEDPLSSTRISQANSTTILKKTSTIAVNNLTQYDVELF